MDYYKYMAIALDLAKQAADLGEVPVGTVIVKDDRIISTAYNEKESKCNPLYHAEILAIGRAAEYLSSWRLDGCTLFVNLEPCPMCAGAILQSRISRIVFGAWDIRWGAGGSVIDILNPQLFNHKVEVISGIMEQQSKELLSSFFKNVR